MAADVSAITYFAPILAFLVVLIVVYAVLFKSEILGKHKLGLLFLSFVVAALFVSIGSVSLYVQTITPWFGALIVSLFFILLLIGLVGGKSDKVFGALKVVFLIIAILIFLISGIVIFSDSLAPWLPGSVESYANPGANWLYSGPVIGAVLLIIFAGIASWILMKGK